MTRSIGGVVRFTFGAMIVAAMAFFLASHGGPMWRSAILLDPWSVTMAFMLSVAYRVVNASGWGLVLGALGEPVRTAPAVRVWLASEACRWIPGSVWAFGSRAVLASVRGISLRVATTSVVLELVATVAAWSVVVMLGASSLPLRTVSQAVVPFEWVWSWSVVIFVATIPGIIMLATATHSRAFLSTKARPILSGVRNALCIVPDGRRLAGVILFFIVMSVFNGLILLVVVRSLAAGTGIPAATVIAANAVAWLAGFLAIFAPGGLVVREACLVALFSAWMPAEQGLAVALAWRLVQVVAEIAIFGAVVVAGLPTGSLRRRLPGSVRDRAVEPPAHASGMAVTCGEEVSLLGVA